MGGEKGGLSTSLTSFPSHLARLEGEKVRDDWGRVSTRRIISYLLVIDKASSCILLLFRFMPLKTYLAAPVHQMLNVV